jgi:hypothetical protein
MSKTPTFGEDTARRTGRDRRSGSDRKLFHLNYAGEHNGLNASAFFALASRSPVGLPSACHTQMPAPSPRPLRRIVFERRLRPEAADQS